MSDNRLVFVIDDDPIVADSTAALLKSSGLNVKTVGSAEEFLSDFDSDQIGCLLLDVRLPGMSGIELHNKLTADGIVIPTILVSGHANNVVLKKLANDVLQILEKPVDAHQLLEVIRELTTCA